MIGKTTIPSASPGRSAWIPVENKDRRSVVLEAAEGKKLPVVLGAVSDRIMGHRLGKDTEDQSFEFEG